MRTLIYQFDLILHLVRRDFRLHYTGSVLGLLWAVVLPLIQLLVFVFLFSRVVPLDIDNYPAFVFSSLLPWTWFSNTIGSAGSLFISNRDLLRRPNFKPATLIVVNTLSNLLAYLISLPILLIVLGLHGRTVTAALLAFPLLLLIQSTLLIGLGLIIATLNVFYRDVQHLTRVTLSLLFYLVPVFYRPQQAGASFSKLLMLNPIAVLIQSYRDIFFYQHVPQWGPLLFAIAICSFIGGLGYLFYSRFQPLVFDAL
jgi:ABC-type polysaccharide/polyol phosphate export permease